MKRMGAVSAILAFSLLVVVQALHGQTTPTKPDPAAKSPDAKPGAT
jgi:hypothetical protein